MGKKKTKQHNNFVYEKPVVVGTQLCIWCPGNNEKWYLVYAPFWRNKTLSIVSIAPRWDDGYTHKAVEQSWNTIEDATQFRNDNIPELKRIKNIGE